MSTNSSTNASEVAVFGAGCFWGVEEVFRTQPGVLSTTVGYAGGHTEHPTYEEVCTDLTGHAEVVRVTFDPTKISYEQLLRIFFQNHNPTCRNFQGPDFGSQYRSVIFYYSPDQKRLAEAMIASENASGRWAPRPIVTQVEPAPVFTPAEEYHQQYLAKRGMSSCHL